MKGIVLGYDSEAEAIVLRAEDGRRHRFPVSEWRDKTPPRKGDTVDFEPDGERARQVYLTGPGQPIDPLVSVAPLTIVSAWGPARFFLTRPVLTCALFVLFACFIGAYAVGEDRISVLQAPDLIARMSEALDSLIAASGADPAPRLGAGVARVLLVFLLGLYAVPVLAVLTLWREFVGRSDRRLAQWTGLAAIALPIGLPLIVCLVVQIWVIPGIPDLGARLGRAGITTPQQVFEVLRLYATGTVILMFAGAALWAAATGRLSASLGLRAPDEAAREVIRPKPAPRSDMFVPLRERRAAVYGIARPEGAGPPSPPAATEVASEEPTPRSSFLSLRERRPKPTVSAPERTESRLAEPADRPVDQGEGVAQAPDSEQASPPPFLKVGAAAAPPPGPAAAPAEPQMPRPTEADLLPRMGSVWPEPAVGPKRRPESGEPPPPAPAADVDVDEPDDQKR